MRGAVYSGRVERLYELYSRDCLRLALSILRDQGLAEDAVHDAFAAAMSRGGKYLGLPDGDFRRLILVMAKNRSIDLLRRRSRELGTESPDHEPQGPAPEEAALARDLARRAFAALDGTTQRIVYLKFVLGLRAEDIGGLMGMSRKAVEGRIARAREKMRCALEEEGGE